MPKPPPIEQQLLDLSALRRDPKSPAAKEKFTNALNGKNNLLAARAATIITETNQADYLPLLVSALDRFFAAGSDKGCPAKTAIANALYTFGHPDAAPFLRGIRHVQPEPGFGASNDSATELRGICALGLVRSGYRDVLLELAALLMDKQPQARIMAARAVAYAERDDGAPLLRMKVLGGDAESEVVSECLIGLMKLTPAKSLEFVARILDGGDPELAQAAALAIGGARLPAAFAVLRNHWEANLLPASRRMLLLPIAMTRQPEAVAFLIERLADDNPRSAAEAVTAIGIYKHDEAIKAKVAAIVEKREERVVAEAFAKAFG